MKKLFIFICMALYLATPSPALAKSKGGGVSGKTAGAFAPYSQMWIIAIGVSRYQKAVYNLEYADDDAKAISELFTKQFNIPKSHVQILLDDQATNRGIKAAFSQIQSKVEKGDGVIFYFSGHGKDLPLPTGGQRGYLIPYDGNMDDLYTTCLDMDELRKMSEMLRAKHVLFLVDSCYSGIAGVQKDFPSAGSFGEVARMSNSDARQIITAGRGNERASENPGLKHGAFTYHVLKGLEGTADENKDGYILAQELFRFVQPRVKSQTNYAQTPQLFALPGGFDGDFIFSYPANAQPPEPPVPAPVKTRATPAPTQQSYAPPPSPPEPSVQPSGGGSGLTTNACGSLTDNATGLEWFIGKDDNMEWDDAKNWASGLNVCGGGWRLPTMAELKAFSAAVSKSGKKKEFFKVTGWFFWSSEPNGKEMWGLNFESNEADYFRKNLKFGRRALAVRNRRN